MGFRLLDGTDLDMVRKDKHVNLTPSEHMSINACTIDEINSAECNRSFANVSNVADLQSAVQSFAIRLANRIAEKGFDAEVSVDLLNPANFDFAKDGALVWHPEVTIVGRRDAYNMDKDVWEVQHGYVDGVEGTMDAHGNMHDLKPLL